MIDTSFHAGGERAFRRAQLSDKADYYCSVAKLRRRIRRWCHAKPLTGNLLVLSFRLRMERKLRTKACQEEALF